MLRAEYHQPHPGHLGDASAAAQTHHPAAFRRSPRTVRARLSGPVAQDEQRQCRPGRAAGATQPHRVLSPARQAPSRPGAVQSRCRRSAAARLGLVALSLHRDKNHSINQGVAKTPSNPSPLPDAFLGQIGRLSLICVIFSLTPSESTPVAQGLH
ncbi:hypothetical protein THICB1_110394 [Thiomonas arsenitoxydans]|uniref:Uncharacterized protein n=1 Tax=Thiomonas arsenitoxydans (strain DSM 22701 / CIP 110005 / 3As) TaxID=426114 RepID=A0ABM9T4E5_THIA3|nr:hypothetical protein THICB1_110394 [Thiomonas arsenitoxydans]CQR28540.1 hypothetical protein ACO7_10149 [Thiomonas arsenitoxydans]CQR28545.1 hypothetical protein ACO3_10149 [Thiomonas arsenitoxydans]CQR30806.1 hypothetical protein THICB6_150457 [Thiomonas arsenitoxydans]